MIVYTKEQQEVINQAVYWFYNSSEQVFEIDGEAGTGKSVVLNAIVSALKLKSYQIAPCAYTGQASIIMRTKGFPHAKSIHSTFYRAEKVKKTYTDDPFKKINTQFNTEEYIYKFFPIPVNEFDKNIKLIIIDEGYMVPESMKKQIEKYGRKVLVAGDAGQLPPVSGNPAYLINPGVHHLTQLMRQASDNPIIYLAHRARHNKPIHSGVYGNKVLVIDRSDLTQEMVLNIGNVLCCTNKTRDRFNTTIRNMLGFDDIPVPQFGERIICRDNNWDITQDNIALANGLQGFCVCPYDVSRYNNSTYTLDFLPDLLNEPFRDIIIDAEYIRSPYDLRNQIKNQEYKIGELFEFAYAITTHVSQGAEYNSCIFYEEPMRVDIRSQLIYTAITRAREFLIYVKPELKYK